MGLSPGRRSGAYETLRDMKICAFMLAYSFVYSGVWLLLELAYRAAVNA